MYKIYEHLYQPELFIIKQKYKVSLGQKAFGLVIKDYFSLSKSQIQCYLKLGVGVNNNFYNLTHEFFSFKSL